MGALSENVSRLRKARDLSQERLAESASVGVDTVARIEQGLRVTCRPATLRRLAAALDVTVDVLLGQTTTRDSADLDVAPLRCAITAGHHIPGLHDDTGAAREGVTAHVLLSDAHQAWRAYVDGRHAELIHVLPELLTVSRQLIDIAGCDDKARAYRALSTAYRVSAGLAGRLDLDDLAWTAAERGLDAARYSDAPDEESAITIRYLTWTLVRQGRFEQAERVAVQAAEQIQPAMFDQNDTRAGVFGNLLFNAASAALFSGNSARAERLLAEAHAAAVRTQRDTANEAAIFGPRVVAFQRVELIAHSGDAAHALHQAGTVPASRGSVPAFWESGHRLRLAAAAMDVRRHKLALSLLDEARSLAPDWARRQPLGIATMRRLVDCAPRRQGAPFSELARHYNVVPA
ncbi:helix-turn-helix domain-containing protein [Haloechinothrix alba]|uniref:helix-turn-helix domain-containing protein n=1 Tax=Haloechinothrix alba TaxID=664784 RepID=UPI001FEBD892|nr:helix-turn-helix transcriptional regulator [Haloechinothrix alba]